MVLKRKDNSPKIIAIGVVIIVAVFYFAGVNNFDSNIGFKKTDDLNDGTFFSTGSAFELPKLDIADGSVTCENISEFYAFKNGGWKLVDSKDNLFFTTADVTSHSDQQIVTKFRADTFVKCDVPNSGVKSLGVNGYVSYLITTGTPGQSDYKILQGSTPITVPTTLLKDNQKTKISSLVFTADAIEDKIAVNAIGSGIIRVQALHGGTYTMLLDNNSKKLTEVVSNVNSEVRHSVYVTPDSEPTETDQSRRNDPISIDSVTQIKSNKNISNGGSIDLDEGKQIKIKATMNNYKTSDGLPKIQISGKLSGTVNLLPVSSSGKNQNFEANILLDRSTGSYSFKMSHPLRDMTPTFSFSTTDSMPSGCPPGTAYDSSTKTCEIPPGKILCSDGSYKFSCDVDGPECNPAVEVCDTEPEPCADGIYRITCPGEAKPGEPKDGTCGVGELPFPDSTGEGIDCLGIGDLKDLLTSGTIYWIVGGLIGLVIVVAILKSAFSSRNNSPY